MATLKSALEAEIARISRRVNRAKLHDLNAAVSALRRRVRDLENRCRKLERESAATRTPATEKASDSHVPEKGGGRGRKRRITSDTILKLRSRLGLSQQQLADLMGVSNQSVSLWERRKGALKLRSRPMENLQSVLGMSKTRALELLKKKAAG